MLIAYDSWEDSVYTVEGYDPEGPTISLYSSDGQKEFLVSKADLAEMIGSDPAYLHLVLSPDGTKILFGDITSPLDYVFDLNFGTMSQLEQIPYAVDVFWNWSPDSTKLVGQAQSTFSPLGIYTINSDGTGLQQIAGVDLIGRQSWSPDSSTVYLSSLNKGIWTFNPDGLNKRRVEIEGLEPLTFLECMQFSPDNKKIAFMVSPTFIEREDHQIFIANTDFSEPALLIEFNSETVVCSQFEWSPDQNFLMATFDNTCVNGSCKHGYEAYVFRTDTGDAVDLPAGGMICGWSPDNSLVYLKGQSEVTCPDGSLCIKYGDHALKLIKLWDSNNSLVSMKLSSCPLLWLTDTP